MARACYKYGIRTCFLMGKKDRTPVPIADFPCFYLKYLQCIRRKGFLFNLFMFLLYLPLNILRISRLITSEGIDIVHVNGIINVVPAIAAIIRRKPIIWHYNGGDVPEPVRALFCPVIALLADRVVIQGQKVGEQYLKMSHNLWSKAKIIYSAVDKSIFSPNNVEKGRREQIRADFGVPEACFLVGSIGNINPCKGLEFFIQAARHIRNEIDNAKFLIVGASLESKQQYFHRLERLVSDLNLEDDVIFTGFRGDIPDILSALDAFVLSSVSEACPNVVLEAISMKVPVVATDVGAVTEMISSGRSGFVVPPGDSDAIAEHVITLTRMSKDDILGLLQKAQEKTSRLFSIDYTSRQQARMYVCLARQR